MFEECFDGSFREEKKNKEYAVKLRILRKSTVVCHFCGYPSPSISFPKLITVFQIHRLPARSLTAERFAGRFLRWVYSAVWRRSIQCPILSYRKILTLLSDVGSTSSYSSCALSPWQIFRRSNREKSIFAIDQCFSFLTLIFFNIIHKKKFARE